LQPSAEEDGDDDGDEEEKMQHLIFLIVFVIIFIMLGIALCTLYKKSSTAIVVPCEVTFPIEYKTKKKDDVVDDHDHDDHKDLEKVLSSGDTDDDEERIEDFK